jgi:hypothetical protein
MCLIGVEPLSRCAGGAQGEIRFRFGVDDQQKSRLGRTGMTAPSVPYINHTNAK